MTDLRNLYQEVILDHYKRPRNYHSMDTPDGQAEGYNPLCGDQVTVYLRLEGDVVQDVSFEGTGCAISTASASLMTEAVKGKTREEAEEVFDHFHRLLTEQREASGGADELGKLEVLSGVKDYPVRIKCATLAWHALRAALEGKREAASTETSGDSK